MICSVAGRIAECASEEMSECIGERVDKYLNC